jgi:predicted deacylase
MEVSRDIETTYAPYKTYKRRIGVLGGDNEGPVLIFIAGMHGNEPSGVLALEEIFQRLSRSVTQFRGKAYAFTGNIKALKAKQRYLEIDLNRLWNEHQIDQIENNSYKKNVPEIEEQIELYTEIKKLLQVEKGPFIFFDLHTTSSASVPFILINDTLNNRSLAERYPLRVILGIEEYLDGPLLSYINDQGHISLGFEAGQHDDPVTREIQKAFILQSFLLTGFMKDAVLYEDMIRSRRKLPYAHSFFEVRHRYNIKEGEQFKMIEGYTNFSKIRANQLLAKNRNGAINSMEAGYLFMPLYQNKGTDGFYIIKLIPNFWLRLSSFLRKINFDYLLLALPGVNRYEKEYKTLVVNVRVARYLSRELFHLLGYRRVKRAGFNLLYIKRETIKS